MEQADTLVLGTSAVRRAGATPVGATKEFIMSKYFLFEMDWSKPMFPNQKEISSEEFEKLVRNNLPNIADNIIKISKYSSGECFLSPAGSSIDKRVIYQQTSN